MNQTLHRLLSSRSTVYGAAALTAFTAVVSLKQRQKNDQDKPANVCRKLMQTQERHFLSKQVTTASASAIKISSSKPNPRQQRFHNFASVEHAGIVYMTPEDFLESVSTTEEKPRYRHGHRQLTSSELDRMLKRTPSIRRASTKLMRDLGREGIISYPEYIFLLCTLANPRTGFSLAFNMIDRSRNQSVEKEEFATLNMMVSQWRKPAEQQRVESDQTNPDAKEATKQQDTTLMRHFFGQSGTDSLNFKQFAGFMSNLQHEVLEIEFQEFARGRQTIAETDFAQVLLRYTDMPPSAQDSALQRVRDRLVHDEGIEFEDFRLFFQFVNSLPDLATALRMYALANHAVTQDEFQRAVRACVGYTLAPRIVATVFLMLDRDGDGSLSSDELLDMLRGRVRRLSPRKTHGGVAWLADVKQCLKREVQKD